MGIKKRYAAAFAVASMVWISTPAFADGHPSPSGDRPGTQVGKSDAGGGSGDKAGGGGDTGGGHAEGTPAPVAGLGLGALLALGIGCQVLRRRVRA